MKPVIDKSLELWERGIELIPRGTQTMSKAPDQFVFGVHPMYLERGNGCSVMDVDGQWYIDYPCALGPIILGHNHKRTVNAIKAQLEKGITFSLMSELEVELAELLCETIPCAEQVRFGKNGSDATSMAVRAARSYTGKEPILIPEGHYHGWHDFFAAVVRPYGIPKCLGELVEHFQYNDAKSLEEKIKAEKYAAVIMEPTALEPPDPMFLNEVRRLCSKHNTVLIFDEMITGFRWALGGAQEYYGVVPDMATFGKAVANGMPISIVAGKREYMQEFNHVFFSSTFGGEACSMAAAIETIKELKERKDEVFPHIWREGDRLRNEFNSYCAKMHIDAEMFGMAPRHNVRFAVDGARDLWHQEMVKRGVLVGTQIYMTPAHTVAHVDATLAVIKESLLVVKEAIDRGAVEDYLEGDPSAAIFKKSVSVGDDE